MIERVRTCLLFMSIVAIASACAGEADSSAVEQEQIGEKSQAITSCFTYGPACPVGYSALYKKCTFMCPGVCDPYNAWECISTTPPPPSGTISASPSTVSVVEGSLGTSRICWNSNVEPSQVYVSENGGTETLFAQARSACQDAPWIQVGHVYDFNLYAGSTHSTQLAQVRVTGILYTPPPDDECGPCQSGYDCRCGDICRPLDTLCP